MPPKAGAHRALRDEQAVQARLRRVAAQLIEQARHVLAHHGVAREQPKVGVLARGLRVVVDGDHMAVALEAVRLLAHNERELAVRLQSDDAVYDVHTRALELARKCDVRVLVEARLEFDEREHLLAGVRGVDERVDDRRVARRAVERLLDREHLRVGCCLREERLHRSGERVVRVVQQDVALADRREDVLRTARLDLCDLAVRRRHERAELEVRPVDAAELEQHGRVERGGQAVDLLRRHAHLVGEQLREERRGLVRDLQADRRPEAAAQQLLFNRVEQVLGVVFLDLDVLVARHAESDDAVYDVHTRALELARKCDVRVLVEARLEFDEREHLLAGVRGVDERVDDRRVARRAVERLLDREHLRVGCCLREERLHRSGERVVRVVQQDVALADRREDVLRTARLDLCDLAVRRRHERAELEVRPVDAAELEQHGRVERGGQAVDLLRRHAHLVGEQLREERRGLVRDLQADRRPEAAAQQLLFNRVEQVLGVVFLDLDVLVARHAERARLLDDHAWEQRLQMRDDQVLHRES